MGSMDVTFTTSGGTDVYEPTEAEFADFLEKEAANLGMSVEVFRRAVAGGELNSSTPEVSYLSWRS